jgi:outer membrane cobalamin receptor
MNTSKATIMGLESKITARIKSHLKASLVYMFLDAKDELLDKRLPYRPRHQLFGYLQHEVDLLAEQLKLVSRLEIEHLGRCYANAMESEEVPSNTFINAKVTVHALNHFQVYLVAKNLGDKKYSLRSGYPLPRRTFFWGLSWEFWD